LTIPIRGDFEEGFQIYGEHGSVNGKVFLPWFHKTSVVECFSAKDSQYHRPLGEDAHTYKRQIEGFADTILEGKPQHGANIDDGVAAMRAFAIRNRRRPAKPPIGCGHGRSVIHHVSNAGREILQLSVALPAGNDDRGDDQTIAGFVKRRVVGKLVRRLHALGFIVIG
jgi:hypothetical protein